MLCQIPKPLKTSSCDHLRIFTLRCVTVICQFSWLSLCNPILSTRQNRARRDLLPIDSISSDSCLLITKKDCVNLTPFQDSFNPFLLPVKLKCNAVPNFSSLPYNRMGSDRSDFTSAPNASARVTLTAAVFHQELGGAVITLWSECFLAVRLQGKETIYGWFGEAMKSITTADPDESYPGFYGFASDGFGSLYANLSML